VPRYARAYTRGNGKRKRAGKDRWVVNAFTVGQIAKLPSQINSFAKNKYYLKTESHFCQN
jgi:hypothetical protein